MKTEDFQLASSFAASSTICGFEAPGGPGSERRYPYSMIAGSLLGGKQYVYLPENYGAQATPGVDDTPAFLAMEADIPATGGYVLLDPTKAYPVNWVLTHNNLQIEGYYGAADNDVVLGLTPYDPTHAALVVGDATHPVHNLTMTGVRLYHKTAQTIMLIQNLVQGNIKYCEIGGGVLYALALAGPASGSKLIYITFDGCYFFATANSTGSMLDLGKGLGDAGSIEFKGCRIDGSAGGSGFHTMRLHPSIEIGASAGTWIQCPDVDRRGIIFEGVGSGNTSRLVCGKVMVDAVSSNRIMVQIPSTEGYINSYLTGRARIDGFAENAVPASFDVRGQFAFGIGFGYGEQDYEPTHIGPVRHCDTTATDLLNSPRRIVGGGSPNGSWAEPVGSQFYSKNNNGQMITAWVKEQGGVTSSGWKNYVTGDWVNQTQPNNLPIVSGTCNLALNAQTTNPDTRGDRGYIVGPGTINFFGDGDHNGIRRLMQIITGNVTINHQPGAGSGTPGIFVVGYRRPIVLRPGDMFETVYDGSNTWRLYFVRTFDDSVPG